jgi:hypothetical protein
MEYERSIVALSITLTPKNAGLLVDSTQEIARIALPFDWRIAPEDVEGKRHKPRKPDSLADHDSKILSREVSDRLHTELVGTRLEARR